MDDKDKLSAYLDVWKQTIDVQKHFNDIEMRVRGLALTVLTFALGAAAVAIKDGTKAAVLGHHISLAALVLFAGAFVWAVFYFVDQVWYHRLLIGAVVHGEAIEAEIAKLLPLPGPGTKPGLTAQISASSPYKLFGLWNLRSAAKIRIFYGAVAVLLVLFGVAALTAEQKETPAPRPSKSVSVAHVHL